MKLARRIHILLFYICLTNLRLASGQDAEFSQFFANPLYTNPALTGTSELPRMSLNYRNQWPRNGATYNSYSVSYDSFIDRYQAGWGIQIMRDRQLNDLIRSNEASLFYSYHLRLDDWSFISAGLQAGLVYRQVDPSNLIFPSMIDQLSGIVSGGIPTNLEYAEKLYPDLGMGIIGQHNDVFGGFSLHHLNRPDESIMEGDQLGRLPVKFTGHAGMRLFRFHRGLFSREFMISPNLIYRQQGSFKQLNTGIYLIEKSFLLGVWYRNNLTIRPDAVIFLAGLAKSDFQLGYSFDYTLSELSNFSYGSHEISLTFFFGRLEGFANPRRLLIPVI
jgi:type IX secretion system PorP/SprF family membrane protein